MIWDGSLHWDIFLCPIAWCSMISYGMVVSGPACARRIIEGNSDHRCWQWFIFCWGWWCSSYWGSWWWWWRWWCSRCWGSWTQWCWSLAAAEANATKRKYFHPWELSQSLVFLHLGILYFAFWIALRLPKSLHLHYGWGRGWYWAGSQAGVVHFKPVIGNAPHHQDPSAALCY